MEGGPPSFTQSSTSSVLLWKADGNAGRSPSHTGLSPSVVCLSRHFCWRRLCNRSRLPQPRPEGRFGLYPRSLAATDGVSVDFLSSRYLDVSVPWVRFRMLCIHMRMTPSACAVTPGFPIRRSPDQRSFDNSPELIAGYHVLHRLSTPRHPPCTLCNLIA